MKSIFLLFIISYGSCFQVSAATRLMDFFQQAVQNDPTYQQVVEQTLANDENISISLSNLLPNIALKSTPQGNKLNNSGAIVNNGIYPPHNTIKSFDTQLNLTQTVVDFAQLSNLSNAKLSSKQAHANLNNAFQDLILRVAQAYLKVLYDEEYLADCKASEKAFAQQLYQTNQLYKANSINKTDVYSVESSYSNAKARTLNAEAILASDKNFLSTMGGDQINDLAKLRESFPVTTPHPRNPEAWVQKAKVQNWKIKSSTFAVQASKEIVKQNQQGHLPTLSMQLTYEIDPTHSAESSLIYAAGASKIHNKAIALNLNLPLYSGGLVVAKTKQALHNFLLAQRQLDAVRRNTVYNARQSYLNIIASIQKIAADKHSIQANSSLLHEIQALYQSGSGTIADVLNQQEKVLQAKAQYAMDKHDYINNLLSLKNAAGTLSVHDLEIINSWLI